MILHCNIYINLSHTDILDQNTDPQTSGGQTFKSSLSSRTSEPQQDDDSDLLDLLADDDDDDEMLALSVSSQPVTTFDPKMSEKPGKDMLEQLKARLMEREETKKEKDIGESGHLYHILDPSDESGGVAEDVDGHHPIVNPRSVYESFNFDSNASYGHLDDLDTSNEPRYIDQSLLTRHRDRRVPEPTTSDASQPLYSNTPTASEHPVTGFYDVPPSRPLQQTHDDGDRDVPVSLYDQIRAVNMEDPNEEDGVYEDLDKCDDPSHIYEQMDSVFMPSGDQGNNQDSTDGAMFSRQIDRPPPKDEELVIFNNLPPLVCAAHLGDEASLLKLSDTASSVIKEAIKNIQNVLSKYSVVLVNSIP